MKDQHRYCSFCGKPEDLVQRLISGQNGAYICNECVEICQDMIKDTEEQDTAPVPLKKPAEIKAELDKYIVGQDEATFSFSVPRVAARLCLQERSPKFSTCPLPLPMPLL